MIKVCLNSGAPWCHELILDCNKNDDIIEAIDELYLGNGLPVPIYNLEEVSEEYEFLKDFYGSFDDFMNENFVPVNGGEVYIDSISCIIEVDEVGLIEDIKYNLVSFINLMYPYSKKATGLIDHIYDLSIDEIKEYITDFNEPKPYNQYKIWVSRIIDNIIDQYGGINNV